jgi:hypothetical protein
MALFTIRNNTGGKLAVPPPVSRIIPANQSVTLTIASGLMDEATSVQQLVSLGAISIAVGNDPNQPDSTEVLNATAAPTLDLIRAVRAASTANLANLNSVSTTMDGLTLVQNDRVLVKNQSSPAENGIYVVGLVSGGLAPFTRSTDMPAAGTVPSGTQFVVSAGTVNGNSIWKLTNSGLVTIAATSLTFEKLPTAGTLAAVTTGNGASLIGIEDAGGLITATTVEGALAEIKALVNTSTTAALTKRTVTVTEAALVNAVNGSPVVVNIGATLPANARIVSTEMSGLTPFTGGAATSVTVKVGTAADDDALIAAADVLAAAVDGGPATITRGVRPNKFFAGAGAQLIATFTPDGAHNLTALTAGSVVIDVWFFVGA